MTENDDKKEITVSRIARKDVIVDGQKIAEKELFYNANDVLIKEFVYKDMHDNRRYDILESSTVYKKGVPHAQTIFKRVQVIKYNSDGSVRNIAKFSD